VLEIGSGSGVVLAALGGLGAASLCGVDVEEIALRSSRELLDSLGLAARTEFFNGDMFQPVAGRRFDLVVANLPHFPNDRADFPGRLPSWADGGLDGRRRLDPFLRGLAEHLAPDGQAVITHNAFVSLDRTQAILADHGLVARIVHTIMLVLPEMKVRRLTPQVLQAEDGRSIHRVGPFVFAELHIVEIRAGTSR
jgi:methylase of polypeptide subunit release factors